MGLLVFWPRLSPQLNLLGNVFRGRRVGVAEQFLGDTGGCRRQRALGRVQVDGVAFVEFLGETGSCWRHRALGRVQVTGVAPVTVGAGLQSRHVHPSKLIMSVLETLDQLTRSRDANPRDRVSSCSVRLLTPSTRCDVTWSSTIQ